MWGECLDVWRTLLCEMWVFHKILSIKVILVRATDVKLTYIILHTCLNSNHLTPNTTLEVDKCYDLGALDPEWTENLALVTRQQLNLTDYHSPLINICDQSDTFCNETSCELSNAIRGDNGSRSHEYLIAPILGSWLIYSLIHYLVEFWNKNSVNRVWKIHIFPLWVIYNPTKDVRDQKRENPVKIESHEILNIFTLEGLK